MKRRLYFVLPDVNAARKVHDELLLARVAENQMHVIAREGTDLSDLPEANLFQKSDIIHGAQLGLILGGFTGVILGSLATGMGFIVAGLEVWSVASLCIGGAFLGAWTSSMVAINIPNTRLKPFAAEIARGNILYMVDLPAKQVEQISDMIHKHHPEAGMHDVEPTIPAFP
ncbi:MAG: DUF1269 domain-containing protein [Gammaproteobacteria bacterium]|nr:DUF1269 domain-containing protein [Gammaproteobacteria bacterium]MDH5652365.1 DUF1269 domain-containing protein [Gammaproteobacteria bacterium]